MGGFFENKTSKIFLTREKCIYCLKEIIPILINKEIIYYETPVKFFTSTSYWFIHRC